MMTTLRKKITALALASTVAAGSFAITPASAAPVAPNQDGLKQSVQGNKEDVRRRGRWVGPAIALGVIGAIGAHQYYNRRGYYDDGYYAPTYYYGPGYGYYGPRRGYYYGW